MPLLAKALAMGRCAGISTTAAARHRPGRVAQAGERPAVAGVLEVVLNARNGFFAEIAQLLKSICSASTPCIWLFFGCMRRQSKILPKQLKIIELLP